MVNRKDKEKKMCWHLLLNNQMSIREIAAKLGVSKNSVQKWKKELQEKIGEVDPSELIDDVTEKEEEVIVATKDKRVRNWTFCIYPDSAPENWRNILDNLHIPIAVSPLHDSDVNGDDTEKKPHWHVILAYDSKKSYAQVMEDVKVLNGTKRIQPVRNMRSMVRYLVHLDNPEKAQYNISEIQCFGGFDVEDFLHATSSDKYKYIREMQAWVIQAKCRGISELMDYAATERFEDWFPLLCDSCTYVMTSYINSKKEIWRDIESKTEMKEIKNEVTSNEDPE